MGGPAARAAPMRTLPKQETARKAGKGERHARAWLVRMMVEEEGDDDDGDGDEDSDDDDDDGDDDSHAEHVRALRAS